MLNLETLKEWLHKLELKRNQRLMLVIATLGGGPVTLPQIREQAAKGGWKIPAKTNISDPLTKSKGLVVKAPDGWELTQAGKQHLKDLGVALDSSATYTAAHDLRSNLDHIKNADAKAFATEAVGCLERGLWRSAVVMSWIGAVHVLYDHVIKNKLPEFNAEAKRINNKWKGVKTIDELAKALGENDFLDRLENIGVISNSIKKELIDCLNRRNSCGHPNSYKLKPITIAHHVEILLSNVYAPFK